MDQSSIDVSGNNNVVSGRDLYQYYTCLPAEERSKTVLSLEQYRMLRSHFKRHLADVKRERWLKFIPVKLLICLLAMLVIYPALIYGPFEGGLFFAFPLGLALFHRFFLHKKEIQLKILEQSIEHDLDCINLQIDRQSRNI